MIHKFSVSEDLISLPHFELFKQIHLLTHLRLLLPNFPAGKVERGRVLERRKLLLWHHLNSFSELALCPVGAGSWSQWFLWLPIEHRFLRGLWNLPAACLGKAPQSICPAAWRNLVSSRPICPFLNLSLKSQINQRRQLSGACEKHLNCLNSLGWEPQSLEKILAKTVFTSFLNIRETEV